MRQRLAWIALSVAAAAFPARIGRTSPLEDATAESAVFSGPTSPHPTSTTRLSVRRSISRTTWSSTDGSRGASLSSRRAEKAASSRG